MNSTKKFRHVAGEVNFTLAVFRLEVIVNLAAPCLRVNDDAGTVVENLLDADTQRLTDTQTTRTTKDEQHSHLRLDGRRIGTVVHHLASEAGSTLLSLVHLRDN